MSAEKPGSKPLQLPDQAFDLYDEYAHGLIDRRRFLSGLSKLAIAGVSAATLAKALSPNYAQAEQVSFNDPAIKALWQTFASPKGHGEGRGYLVQPSEPSGPLPAVVVIHENRGLNPYVADVARRLAKAGFLAFAPDGLYPAGGYPGNDDDGRRMQREMDRDKLVEDLFAAARFVHDHPGSNGRLGVVGFCFGGSMANRMAVELPDLIDAAVPFYGSPPDLERVDRIRAPLLIQMGGTDERINAQWPAYKAALEAHGIRYQAHVYPDAPHGFHNDSTPRYTPDAAELAWQRTIEFFNQHLRT